MQLASHHDKQNNFRFVFRLPCVPRYKLIKEVIIVKLKTKDALNEKIMNNKLTVNILFFNQITINLLKMISCFF